MSDEQPASRAPLPVATLNDPQLQVAARHPRRIENLIAVSFFLGLSCVGGFGAAFWQNWRPWTLGLTLGAGMAFFGFGVISWGKYLMPRAPSSRSATRWPRARPSARPCRRPSSSGARSSCAAAG